jgi:hypothetical protein
MNDKVLNSLENAINDNTEVTRRRFPRRTDDTCIASINNINYPVEDWSACGVLLAADGRDFKAGSTQHVVMKFKLQNNVTEIPVEAKVIRASKSKIALEFFDVPKKIQNAFTKVIEDYTAQNMLSDTMRG